MHKFEKKKRGGNKKEKIKLVDEVNVLVAVPCVQSGSSNINQASNGNAQDLAGHTLKRTGLGPVTGSAAPRYKEDIMVGTGRGTGHGTSRGTSDHGVVIRVPLCVPLKEPRKGTGSNPGAFSSLQVRLENVIFGRGQRFDTRFEFRFIFLKMSLINGGEKNWLSICLTGTAWQHHGVQTDKAERNFLLSLSDKRCQRPPGRQ